MFTPTPAYLRRIVTDGNNREAWMRARSQGVTATDAAKLSSQRSLVSAAREKKFGSSFNGNMYTNHGNIREPEIAAWVLQEYGITPNRALFHAENNTRHLATPDGIVLRSHGALELSEIKTTNKQWRSIPLKYLRQIWWQQYVLGAERTLMVWEQHENFVPVGKPNCCWVDRDDTEIERLVHLAGQLIRMLIQGPEASTTGEFVPDHLPPVRKVTSSDC